MAVKHTVEAVMLAFDVRREFLEHLAWSAPPAAGVCRLDERVHVRLLDIVLEGTGDHVDHIGPVLIVGILDAWVDACVDGPVMKGTVEKVCEMCIGIDGVARAVFAPISPVLATCEILLELDVCPCLLGIVELRED